jgi:hypothetical protein
MFDIVTFCFKKNKKNKKKPGLFGRVLFFDDI